MPISAPERAHNAGTTLALACLAIALAGAAWAALTGHAMHLAAITVAVLSLPRGIVPAMGMAGLTIIAWGLIFGA